MYFLLITQNFNCGARCSKDGCNLSHQRKLQIFEEFWAIGNHNTQSIFLRGLIKKTEVKERTTNQPSRRNASYQYFLTDIDGHELAVCFKTFLHVFSETKKRIEEIQKKLSAGVVAIKDNRGLTPNPRTVSQPVRQGILDFINELPFEESHYTRNVNFINCLLLITK